MSFSQKWRNKSEIALDGSNLLMRQLFDQRSMRCTNEVSPYPALGEPDRRSSCAFLYGKSEGDSLALDSIRKLKTVFRAKQKLMAQLEGGALEASQRSVQPKHVSNIKNKVQEELGIEFSMKPRKSPQCVQNRFLLVCGVPADDYTDAAAEIPEVYDLLFMVRLSTAAVFQPFRKAISIKYRNKS
jgi:hypothetical protein